MGLITGALLAGAIGKVVQWWRKNTMNKKIVYKQYDIIASWFDEHRSRDLFEKSYLDKVMSYLPSGGSVLDLGCGMAEPIGKYFIEQGFALTGVDGSEKLIALAQSRFPQAKFIVHEMQTIDLQQRFDAVLAWHSLFHLAPEDQSKMFTIFAEHCKPGGILLFTSGPQAGEVWSDNGGENLYHASLSADAYKKLLQEHGFELLLHTINDANCGDATVWMAKCMGDHKRL